MADEPRKRCPECRGKVQRLISGGAGLLFKGSGFYTTDYRSEGYKESAKADKPSESKGEGKKGDSAKSGSSGGGDAKKDTKKPAATSDS